MSLPLVLGGWSTSSCFWIFYFLVDYYFSSTCFWTFYFSVDFSFACFSTVVSALVGALPWVTDIGALGMAHFGGPC